MMGVSSSINSTTSAAKLLGNAFGASTPQNSPRTASQDTTTPPEKPAKAAA